MSSKSQIANHKSQIRQDLSDYITPPALADLIRRARDEDMGPQQLDLTSVQLIKPNRRGEALMKTRQSGRLAGAAVLATINDVYGRMINVNPLLQDGDDLDRDVVIAELTGLLHSILALERVALNFVSHLSGIATMTAQFVQAVGDTKAVICDTRKTVPGLRALAKYAVACGGGVNHRLGLHDAVLIKDNHLRHMSLDILPAAVARCRAAKPAPAFIEVEVDDLAQLKHVLHAGVDMVLLDNMTSSMLREAVTMRDAESPAVQLEASGNVTLDNVGAIADTGIDRISVGAITHSAPALDMGLDVT